MKKIRFPNVNNKTCNKINNKKNKNNHNCYKKNKNQKISNLLSKTYYYKNHKVNDRGCPKK